MIQLKSLIQPAQLQQSLERLPGIANVILVLVLAATLARISWDLVPASAPDEMIPQVTRSGAMPRGAGKVAGPALSSIHLFGKVEQEAAAPVVQETVPVTRLNLTLRGVLSSTSTTVAKAIIADSSGQESFYSLGMQIPGGAILEEIHDDHVIIKRNNRLETLLLPEEVKSAGSVGGIRRPTTSPTSRATTTTGGLSANKTTGALLKDWRGKLDTDPQSLMNLVRAQPVRRDGALIGYRIRPGKDRQLLRKFGLRSGDIVKEVNGMPLDNPLKGLEILNNLKTSSQVNLSIERHGSTQSFVFQVDP